MPSIMTHAIIHTISMQINFGFIYFDLLELILLPTGNLHPRNTQKMVQIIHPLGKNKKKILNPNWLMNQMILLKCQVASKSAMKSIRASQNITSQWKRNKNK